MTGRRILSGFALLLAAASAAGCAQQVPGSGSFSADARVGGGGSPTSSRSPSPASTAEPTASPSSTPSSSSTSGGPSPVCQALDEPAIEDAFGTSVTLSRSQSTGCQVRADDGRSVIVAVFDYLTLNEYRKAGSTDLQVAGHPGIRTATTIIYVARSEDAAKPGLLAAYFGGLGDGGQELAVKLLEQLLTKYSR